MRRARRWTSVLLLALSAAVACAFEVPMDAEMLVTDTGSRIVGVGRVVAGVRFDLVLVEGFAGPAVVVWLTPDGGVRTTEVVVLDGVVWVDGDELTTLLSEAFDEVRVRVTKDLGDAWPPGVAHGPPDEVAAPVPAPGRDAPASADPPGPPADGPAHGDPPGPPADGPAHGDPPGPPADGPAHGDPPAGGTPEGPGGRP